MLKLGRRKNLSEYPSAQQLSQFRRSSPPERRLPGNLIAAVAAASLASSALAQSAAEPSTGPIPTILVTLGLEEDENLVTSPFSVLNADEAFQGSSSLGDLLDGLPGVHADSFGGGSSRPVIRGQTSPRVSVLSDGAGILDASEVSPDHAMMVEPLLARRIEVLRGPATLLYGGGAIGGVVNVLDNKVPRDVPERGADAFMGVRGNTAAGERAGAVSLTTRAGEQFAWHVEASSREAKDYKAPGIEGGRAEGTFADSETAAIGASWIGANGYLGLAYSYRADEYGIPGHDEEYAGCHAHGSILHCEAQGDGHGHDHNHGHDHDHGHDDHIHGIPVVDLKSERIDLRSEIDDPMAGIHRIRIRGGYTDYRHVEVEHDHVITEYTNKGYEGRIEVDHAPIAGWHGVFGVQHSNTRFASLGVEAFIPETDSRATGLFIVEHYELTDAWHLELGARYERQSLSPRNDSRHRPSYDSSTFSYSGAAVWAFDPNHTLAMTYARAQRLPGPQELYARGVHLATNTYECGLIAHPLTCGGAENNAPIGRETSHNIDVTLRRHTGRLTYMVNAFRNNADDYIYARTLDQAQDFRLVKYTQADAALHGFEAEISWQFNDAWATTIYGDSVRARFRHGGGNLPRISPARVGARLDGELLQGVGIRLDYYRVASQTRVADHETATAGHHMLTAGVTYDLTSDGQYTLFLRGHNLLNEEVRSHSSFLSDVLPMPGRNISAGFTLNF